MPVKCASCDTPLDDDGTCPFRRDRSHVRLDAAIEQIEAMQREGCAAAELVQNIFNGLTSEGAPTEYPLNEMADACAKLLFEAAQCAHKERAEAAEAREDCSARGGWLSDGLECGREADPSCWKHRLEAEAQGKGGY